MREQRTKTLVPQLFRSLILAQIIANITPSLANISNGLLIGNSLSPTAMAALSFAAPTGGLFAAIAAVVSLGANILCGNCIGRGENDQVNRIFTTATATLAVIGIGLTAVTEVFPGTVAALLGAEGDALPETIDYLRGLCVGILPTLLVPCLVVFLNMANEITYAMSSTIVLAAVNLLVGFVNLRILNGGMLGMGLASAISEYAAFFFLAGRFWIKKHLARIDFRGFVLPYVWKIIVLGSPSALMLFLYSIRNIQINAVSFETGGTVAVTALGVLSSSSGIFDAVNTGIGSTLVLLASVMAGEEDRDSLKKLVRYTLAFGGILVLVKTGVYAALAHPIVSLFGVSGTEYDMSVICIYAYALCMPFNLLPIVMIKIYQCLNRVFLSNVLYGLTCIVFPFGIMYGLKGLFGIYGVWSCYALSEVFTILTLLFICWGKSGRFPRSAGDLLWLDQTFHVPEEHQFFVAVAAESEVGTAAFGLKDFLQRCGVTEAESTHCASDVAEALKRMLGGSSRRAGRQHQFLTEIFAAVREDRIYIRFRDNYAPIDLSAELAESLSDGGYGREIKYQSNFGMNVLMTVYARI